MNEKTLGWFRRRPESFTCSSCAATVRLAPAEVAALVDSLERINQRVRRIQKGRRNATKKGPDPEDDERQA